MASRRTIQLSSQTKIRQELAKTYQLLKEDNVIGFQENKEKYRQMVNTLKVVSDVLEKETNNELEKRLVSIEKLLESL